MLNFKVIITQRGGARPCRLGHWNLNLLIQSTSPALTTHRIWNRLWFNSPAKYPTGLPFPVEILEQFSSFVVFRSYLLLGYSRSIFKYLKVVTSGTGFECRIRVGVVSYSIVSWVSYRIQADTGFEPLLRGLFLKSPETFQAYFGWHNSLCIFKTKASRGTKLCSYFCFYSLYNIWKDQLYRISRSHF